MMRNSLVAFALVALGFLSASPGYAQEGRSRTNKESVSLFQVPWQCPAAPEIACGGVAKPILLELERDPNISQAWVNRKGTVLAVVGRERSTRQSRGKVVQALLLEIFEKKVAKELKGTAREEELTRFLSADGWYRGADADSLSSEEADIIGARLVRRIQARTALSDEQARALESGFAKVFKGQFIQSPGVFGAAGKGPIDQKQRNEQLLKVAREHLDAGGLTAFHEAIAKGHRPLAGEK
ncbi:hypothetical protein OVY29_21725 [Sphingopyxis sp. SE2]|uniref:hypothetical protein n=1 Tax=Sphingopyxis sp. SE2 TaxID=1586240 RepID=UPI0028BFB474|nr:hypothetical protein [Sphingopyxis sp. SE2]MDT7531281.1 hypothetical protein [Sphingopyxis sp. SE2]